MSKRFALLLLFFGSALFAWGQTLPVKQVFIDGLTWDTLHKQAVGNAHIELFRLIDGRPEMARETESRDDGYFSFALIVPDTATVSPAFFRLRLSKHDYTTDTIIITQLPPAGKNSRLHADAFVIRNTEPAPTPVTDCAPQPIVINGIARDSISLMPLAGVGISVFLDDSLIWRGITLDKGEFISDSIRLTVGQAMRISAAAIKTGYRYEVCTCAFYFTSLATCRMFTQPVIEATALMQKEDKSVRLIPHEDH